MGSINAKPQLIRRSGLMLHMALPLKAQGLCHQGIEIALFNGVEPTGDDRPSHAIVHMGYMGALRVVVL